MNNNFQNKAPLFDSLKSYIKSKTLPFHVPGHKMGDGIDNEFKNFIGNAVFQIDLTSFKKVNNPQKPSGVIKEPQILASKLYGSDYSFFV